MLEFNLSSDYYQKHIRLQEKTKSILKGQNKVINDE